MDNDGIDIVGRAQHSAEIAGRIPVSQFWDSSDPKLIVCETVSSSSGSKEKTNKKSFSILPKDGKDGQLQVCLQYNIVHQKFRCL